MKINGVEYKDPKFKVGDRLIAKEGGMDIWIIAGKQYIVLDIESEYRPGNKCYKNCGHDMHEPKLIHLVKVIDEFNKKGLFWEDCFILDVN